MPEESANEAAVIDGLNIYPVENLDQMVAHLLGKREIEPAEYEEEKEKKIKPEFDMKEVLGQEQAKRAAEIAAAGGHNLFMIYPLPSVYWLPR